MPVYDANGLFHDGTTITADISPTSETRASGSVALNLKKTGVKGLSAVLIVGADLAEASDTLQVTMEECATVDGTYVEMARFPLLTKGTGMPGTYILRFQAEEAFVRAKIDITDDDTGGDFTVASVYIFLTPHAYRVL